MGDMSTIEILVEIQPNQLQASIYRHLLAHHEQGITPEQFCDFFENYPDWIWQGK